MNTGLTIQRSFVAAGPLPLWAVVLLVLAALAAALWLLRSEARARRRPVRLGALLAIRAAVIVMLGLLLAQVVLVTRTEERRPATLLLLADRSRSMLRADAYRGSALLDLAQALGTAGLDERPTAAGKALRLLQAGRPRIEASRASLARIADELSQGLPWSSSFTRDLAADKAELDRMAESLRPLSAAIAQSEAARAGASRPPAPAPAGPTTAQSPSPAAAASPAPATAAALSGEIDLSGFVALPAQIAAVAAALTDPSASPTDAVVAESLIDRFAALAQACDAAIGALTRARARDDGLFAGAASPALRAALDELAAAPRFELARRLANRAAVDPRIASRHRVELAGFDPLTVADAVAFTDLYEPLADALARRADATISGVVLLSDGQQNVPEAPAALTRLTARSIPFFAAGVGIAEEPLDVAIVDHEAPTLVQRDKPVDLLVRLKTAVPAGTDVQVTLADGEKVIASTALKADGSRMSEALLHLRLAERPAGVLTLKASMSQGDAAPANDAVMLAIAVIDRPSRVLVVSPAPRWDVVALLRALTRAPVRIDTVFWDRGEKEKALSAGADRAGDASPAPVPTAAPTAASPDGAVAAAPAGGTSSGGGGAGGSRGRIPTTLAAMKRYDLIVLDGRTFPGMSDADAALLAEYVAREGGRLLVLQGSASEGYLARLTSLTGPAATPSATVDAGRAVPLAPPGEAASHASVALAADPAQSAGLWRTLSQPRRFSPVAPLSLTLLEHAGRPVLSVALAGKGRVYALGCADLYRLREWDDRGSVDQFLLRLVEDALRPTAMDPAATVGLYPRFPVAGGRAWVVAPGAGASPPRGRAVPATGEPVALSFNAIGPAPVAPAGASASGTSPAPSSSWAAPIRLGAGPFTLELEGQPPLKADAVAPIFNEDVEIRLDAAALERLALGAGGQSLPPGELIERLAELPARVETAVSVRETRLWNAWAFLLLIVAAMTLEWVLRRKSGFAL